MSEGRILRPDFGGKEKSLAEQIADLLEAQLPKPEEE